MNPSDTPGLAEAYSGVLSHIEGAHVFDAEASKRFSKIVEGYDPTKIDYDGIKITLPSGIDKHFDRQTPLSDLKDKDAKDPAKGYSGLLTATYRIYENDPSSILVQPMEPHDTYITDLGASVSSRFLVTKLGDEYNITYDTGSDMGSQDTLLLLKVGTSNERLGAGVNDVVGVNIRHAIKQSAATGELTYFEYVEEQVTKGAVVLQQVVRKDSTEENGEAVDARLETPQTTLVNKYFRKLDPTEDAELISELRKELELSANRVRNSRV